MVSVPSGVGCVHTHAFRRTIALSHALTPGSADTSAAAIKVRARKTCSALSYPVSAPAYTDAASSGDMSGTVVSASAPAYVCNRRARDSGVAPYRGSRSRSPFLT